MPIVDRVAAAALATPDAPAVVAAERTLTYGELARRAAMLDLGSATTGPDGQCLTALCLTDPVDFVVAFTAAISAGHCAAVLDPAWPKTRLDEALARLDADVVLQPLDHQRPRDGAPELKEGEPAEVFYLGFTSGSSSRPKIFLRDRASWRKSLDRSTDVFGLRPGKRVMACGSLASSLSMYALAECLYTGAAFHWLDAHEAVTAPARIEALGIEHLVSTPALLDLMARRADHPWNTVETVVCGGAGLGVEQREGIRRAAGNATLFEYYGASELSLVTLKRTPPGEPALDESAGTPFTGVDLDIRSSRNGRNTVWVRTDTACRGYLDAGTPLEHDDGWYTVGDQGWIDECGRLHLLGRASGMIVTSGLNVYPEEVETALGGLGLAGSCVVGRAHPVRGTQLVAVLSRGAARGRRRTDLRRRLRATLTAGAVPDLYLVLDSLPLLSGGKLDRTAIGKIVAEEGSAHEYLP